MLSYSFNSGALPNTMMDANISYLNSEERQACGRLCLLQALLDIANIFASNFLSKRLEGILPDIIAVDQTGFILGHTSSNNIRRLLNLVQFSSESKACDLLGCREGLGQN